MWVPRGATLSDPTDIPHLRNFLTVCLGASVAGVSRHDRGMTTTLLIGTKKGLWIATSEDRQTWDVQGPEFPMQAVSACAVDVRGGSPRILVGATSEHWGPTVSWSDDHGTTWQETPGGGVRFPEGAGASVEALWQLAPDTAERPGVVWAGTQPSALWRSEDGGETFELVQGLWDHPHRPTWAPGYGGQAVHTVLPDPSDDDRVLVAMSTGGVYVTEDRGASWNPSNTGIHAWFFPEPLVGVRPVRAQGRARLCRPGRALRAEPRRGIRLP